MDWSEKDLCIKCNEGGNLLVCSENGCPLAVHEGCMGCPARFDDAGCFYCPYCLYKQAVGEAHRAKEHVLARKKDLLLFMDEKTLGTEQHIGENERAEYNGHNESKISKANGKIITLNDGKIKLNSDAIINEPIQHDEEQKINNSVEDINNIEEPEASAGSKGRDPSIELHEEQRISDDEEKQIREEGHKNQEEGQENLEEEHENQEEDQDNQEEKHDTSAASGEEDCSHKMHEHEVSDDEDKKIQEEQGQATSGSTGEGPSLTLNGSAKRVSKRRKPVDRDSDAVSVPNKLRKRQNKNNQRSPIVDSPRRSSRKSSSTQKIESVSPMKLASDAFGSGKRKRLLWREEEEEHLKAGVAKYSKEANKNIPWRKILDMGKFDASRTPGDLKDKWRNMTAK